MKYLLLLLLLVPGNVGCAALPMDGSLLKKVASKEQGPVCECSTSKPESVCYCGPQECGAP